MRTNVLSGATLFAFVAVFAAGCGGPEKPAEPPSVTPPPSAEPSAAPSAEPVASAEPAPSAAPSATPAAPPASPPVAATALKGTVKGKAFTPKAALAYADPNGDKSKRKISIFDRPVDCKNRDKLDGKGRAEVSVIIPWTAKGVAELDPGSAGIFIDEKDKPVQIGNLQGRAELDALPPKVGTKGKIRVRVSDQAGENKVEGEVPYTLCE